jgi:peptidoglycan/LPS O-acetylase OafA/YrhL
MSLNNDAPVVREPAMPLSAYTQSISSFVVTLAAAFVAVNTDNELSRTELAQLLALACSSALVLIVPSLSKGVGRFAKPGLAFVGAGAVAAMPFLVGTQSPSLNEWILVVLGAMAALGVAGLPNNGYLPRSAAKPLIAGDTL